MYANSRATNEEIKGKLNNLAKEIVNLNDKLCKEIIEFLEGKVLNVENFNELLLVEVKNMQKQAMQISDNEGDIQTVDIQKFAYKKSLDIMEQL